ncbi:ComEC/Rec2 family competence protein [Kribbella pittospori]|nr:MBL fold metallo-hydrolase [Kribbella pittospori]
MTETLVETLDAASFDASTRFETSIDKDDLVYFLLNVGDGDTQLILLPETPGGHRHAVVVDCATTKKLPQLVAKLGGVGLLKEPPPGRPLFELVVATHPHQDHIGGMPEFLDKFGDQIGEFWEPGYFHTVAAYAEMMRVIEDLDSAGHSVRHSQPTAGYTRYIGHVQVMTLTPAISLRNRFDTYGIEINNSSIAMRLEFPASRVVQQSPDREFVRPRTQRLLLGADAQTVSWAHALTDFPELHPDESAAASALRVALGKDPLKADVFKVPHHLSKHGLSLELVEQIAPALSLVSSVAGGGKYNFPHTVSQQAIREALQAVSSGKIKRKADHELGIHYTSAKDSTNKALGTICVVISPTGKRSLWRFGDRPADMVDLNAARRWTTK